ncbi:MAG: DUF6607 family protein [Planctomycetota bacterium]
MKSKTLQSILFAAVCGGSALAFPAVAHACPGCGCESGATPHTHEHPSADKAEGAGLINAAVAADEVEPVSAIAFEQDRAAILKQAGVYEVDFRFFESVPLVDGYELRDPYESGATEFVEVVVDEPELIELQHILVMRYKQDDGELSDAVVIKHWRQTWKYEPTQVLQYVGENTWQLREVTEQDRGGAWSQTVWQVDDSPRYGGVGRWDHSGGVSSWTSGPEWRPLPRREHTKRDDYDVMGCTNRHTLTPDGWVHEQDNTKIVLGDDGEVAQVLAREIGVNTYKRVGEAGFDTTPGREYWAKTAPFWADVREAWDARLAKGSIRLQKSVDDKRMYQRFFAYAKGVESIVDAGGSYEPGSADTFIRDTIELYSEPAELVAR